MSNSIQMNIDNTNITIKDHHQNTKQLCRAPGSPVPGHLAHHLAETSVRQLVPNLEHELTTISSLHTSMMLLLLMMINMMIIRMIKIVRITSGVGRSEAKLAVLSDIARSWYV